MSSTSRVSRDSTRRPRGLAAATDTFVQLAEEVGAVQAVDAWVMEESLRALALGLHLFDFGRARQTRLRFARELAQQTAMRDRWFRSLVLELKR